MLEGVKALFRFTMAILYLAFQVTPPSSCEIYQTIRNTAKDMYDIKLLLSIVSQIKLPKDSYFAIRRSFYMVQSSFNSDQFYMQTLSSDTSRTMVANKPLSVQKMPDTKAPSLCLMSSSTASTALMAKSNGSGSTSSIGNPSCLSSSLVTKNSSLGQNSWNMALMQQQQSFQKPRIQISADRTKICIQSLGKLGRSHLRIIDTNSRSNERSLMNPLRNCLVVGITNSGKSLIFARQSSKRNYRSFREQDLSFHIHELHTEIFDGFFLEELSGLVIIITHSGEIFKINTSNCSNCSGAKMMSDTSGATSGHCSSDDCTETLMLRDSGSLGEHEKIKLRLCTMDCLTKLLWIYLECEDLSGTQQSMVDQQQYHQHHHQEHRNDSATTVRRSKRRFKHNNPFLAEFNQDLSQGQGQGDDDDDDDNDGDDDSRALVMTRSKRQKPKAGSKSIYSGKIIIVDIVTFDLFSAFAVHSNFGEITNLRASLVAFCQLLNPASNQFSTRIVQIGPTGRYEQLLSFSDVVDYMICVPESYKKKYMEQSSGATANVNNESNNCDSGATSQRYSTLKRLLTHSMSFHHHQQQPTGNNSSTGAEQDSEDNSQDNPGTLTRYYRSLIKSYSSAVDSGTKEASSMDSTSADNKCTLDALDLSASDCNSSEPLRHPSGHRNGTRATDGTNSAP